MRQKAKATMDTVTRRRLRKLRALKKTGATAERALELLTASCREAAKRDGWRPSEYAVTLGAWYRLVERVWGKGEPR